MRQSLINLAIRTLRATLSLPGEDFYERASRVISRALWHEQWRHGGKHGAKSGWSLPDIVIRPADLGNGQSADMFCIGEKAVFRAKKLLTKEPSTIKWLDRMTSDDVLWDIGANVGSYTLYAAIRRCCRVIAIEPSAANYYLLNKNIELNKLSHRVTALCAAATSGNGFGFLNLPNTAPGEGFSEFGRDRAGSGAGFQQGMVGVSLDALAQEAIFPAPTFIKIDVDGLEQEVVKGARMLLRTGKVRSVLVERDIGRPDLIQELNQEMAKHAFDLVETGMRSDRTPSVVNCIYDRRGVL